jgi:hypothetical protein
MRIDYPLLIAPAYETANDESQLTFCAPVLDLGQPARDKLVHNRRWTAIACFRRSIYLRGGNGDIVCLCSPFIDPGPLNVRCALPEATDWRRLDLGAERTAVVERESLRFGSKTIFYFGQAQIWEPPHVDSLGGTRTGPPGACAVGQEYSPPTAAALAPAAMRSDRADRARTRPDTVRR